MNDTINKVIQKTFCSDLLWADRFGEPNFQPSDCCPKLTFAVTFLVFKAKLKREFPKLNFEEYYYLARGAEHF